MEKKRMLLTGGSKGIGEAIVRAARDQGWDVTFTGRDEERLRQVAEDTGAHAFRAEVNDFEDNQRTVEFAAEKMGGIDVLVNNAAIGYFGIIGELDMEKVHEVLHVNWLGLVDLTNRVVPYLKEAKGSDIVNIASTSGVKGHKGGTAYAASKWAVRGLTQCWQAELRPHNIRVTCVCPSEVQTGFSGGEKGANPNKLFAEDIAGSVIGVLSMHPRGFIPEYSVFATNPWGEG